MFRILCKQNQKIHQKGLIKIQVSPFSIKHDEMFKVIGVVNK